MTTGTSTLNIYYRGGAAQSLTLTAAASGLTSGTLGVTVQNGTAGSLDDGEEHAVTRFELLARQARLAQKAVERLRRSVDARTLDLLPARLRRLCNVAGDQRQSPRGRENVDRASS